MILRRLAAILFLPMLVAFGSGVYLYLGTLKSKVVKTTPQVPPAVKAKFALPGTMYVVQDGRLYKLSGGNFTEIATASGNWSQPALTPDHKRLVAVLRGAQSSDLYLLDLEGKVIKRLTRNDSRTIDLNHWAFYPRVTPDGSAVVYSYDSPKLTENVAPGVDLAIWTMPLNGTQAQSRIRTFPYWYTGGDVSPIPLAGSGLLYVRHSIDPSTTVHSQIYFQSRPGTLNQALTRPEDDCGQPALSPDETQLAMICSGGKPTAKLEVAPFNGTALGPPRVLLEGGLYASPAWSPDGKALAYLAPAGATGHFQLWYVPVRALPAPAASASGSAAPLTFPTPIPTPPVPMQVTQGVNLSATSPPVWY